MHKPIGSIFTLVGGGTPSTKDERYWGNGIPWFSSADIDRFGAIKYRKTVTELGVENSTTNIVGQGIVVVVTRVGLGKVALLPCDMCFSQDIQALIPKNTGEVFGPFVFYQLQYIMQSLRYKGQGTTISGITKKQLADVNFYLPVHSEQERIVSKIEELFSKLDASVAELQTAKEKLKVYRQAMLKEALEGDYPCVRLKEIATAFSGYAFKSKKYSSDGRYVVVKIGNVKPFHFDFSRDLTKTSEIDDNILNKYLLKKGDCLITMTGSRGKRDYGYVAMIEDQDNYLLNQRVSALRFNDSVALPKFYGYVLSSPQYRNQFFSYETGNVGQGNVGIKALTEPTVICPTLKTQEAIMQSIEFSLSLCDSIEQSIDTSLQQAEALRQSILKQAFEGIL